MFENLDQGSILSRSTKSLLSAPIKTARRKSRKPGFTGACWLALESLLRFIFKTPDVYNAFFLSILLVPMWMVYIEKGEGATSSKVFCTVICAIGIFWTWLMAVRNHDLNAIHAMMLDFGKLLHGERLNKDASAYRYLVDQYRSGHCTRLSNPITAIRAACVCEEQDTINVQRYYECHSKTATDWLCVIRAKQATAFLEASQFGLWLVYFHGFNRATQPTDRISRVFSTPVPFPGTPMGPKWGDSSSLLEDERFRLLAYLFINRAVGVDTKLHCFDPSQDESLDFFHEADYIIVNDPVCESSDKCETLFIAIPGNEKRCLRLNGRTIWGEAFRFEFYNRLTHAHGSRHCDSIEDATTEKASKLVSMLGLSGNLNERWSEVKDAIVAHSGDFHVNELQRLERRWREWFSC